jgi:Competence protein CoiA-like family
MEFGWQSQHLQPGYYWGIKEGKDIPMLVAYGPEGQPVVAEEVRLAQLKDWSQRDMLYCPNCRGVVHVRGGPEKRTQIHFAHQKGECSWGTESETIRHLRGKIVLAEWLQKQFPQATISLEKRLPEPNRIADIFVTYAGGPQWAIEFQCAPLDVAEWQTRHAAYLKANIRDTWIIGSNRREKKETFIEAVIASASEVMFIDPLLTSPLVWIRWAITRDTIREWQIAKGWTPSLEGWVGRSRSKYGATLSGLLQDVTLGVDGHLIHPNRSELETRMSLLRKMRKAQAIDEVALNAYLKPIVGREALNVVLFPILHAYLLDPDLFSRYNYGRGFGDDFLSETDRRRVEQARIWLERLAQQGFSACRLEKLAQEIPHVGPYMAFANYVEMLAFLSRGATNKQG